MALGALLLLPSLSVADGILDVYPGSDPEFAPFAVFPNWYRTPIADLYLWECDDITCSGCTASSLRGVTITNYGTATGGAGGDITGLYFRYYCGSASAEMALAFAGNWGGQPTWTWAGTYNLPSDPCGTNCWCWPSLLLYADIGSCPTDGASIALGPRFNVVGGIRDSCGYAGPSSSSPTPDKYIRYVTKTTDRDQVVPGDTVAYTIYYGKPGTTNPTAVVITDTQPPYTHWIPGGTTPDSGWDPNYGPPLKLRWTIPGLNPAGGATGRIVFNLTVDWGNGDSFESGSGDVGAPEGSFLLNQAHMSWTPQSTCAPTAACCISSTTATTVARFMFWKVGDNDVLFAGRLGQPDDEMIYSIFMKNTSPKLTWWDVRVWDTVPPELDVWSPGYGMEDPCAGWTMTPSGCAFAAAGRVVSGANTILTWKLDMPPGMTLELRWKSRIRQSAPANGTVLNRASILEMGRTRIVGGTGHSGKPRIFTHQAPIVLRTTYNSYVAYAGADDGMVQCGGLQTYWISLYPLNKATNFALYKKWCCPAAPCDASCAAFANLGGVSPKIDVMTGTCVTGGGGDWEIGCKAERAPARYVPNEMAGPVIPAFPFNFLHKLVSNSPVIWELAVCMPSDGMDANTFAGTTSLSFAGYTVYTYPRVYAYPSNVDHLYLVNTRDDTPTTVYAFEWNAGTLSWDILDSKMIYNESQWVFIAPETNHYRIISSDSPLIAHKAYTAIGQGGGFNDSGTLAPNRENGNLVSSTVPATFYLYAGPLGEPAQAIVGNVGGAKATYEVYRYVPLDPSLPQPSLGVTVDLVGSAGRWIPMAVDTVDTGIGAAANPHIYGTGYDTGIFLNSLALYKVVLTGGGPIQTYCGRSIFYSFSGGSMLHSSDPPGLRAGREFWMHESNTNSCSGASDGVQCIDIFAPKTTMVVRMVANDGYSATYTTNDVDECISFKALSPPSGGARRNWRANVLAGGNPGDGIAQYNCCKYGEKFFTAPFLSRGTYYDIIAPPVVYAGQSFWITVVVMDTAGGTRTDYTGTTSFTSTDPAAKIEGKAMDTYNFTWNGCGTYCGVKIFFNVSLTVLGLQTIIAADTMDGSIIGIATILVVGADVKLEKRKRLTVAASGDTVQFEMCWQNISSATAFSFMITDAVPMGTTYVPQVASTMLCWSSSPAPGLTVWYSTATTTTPPGTFTSVPGTSSPLANTRWLRWTVRDAYVNSSGCVCFKVSVN